jgi:hypothetical protein
MFGIARVVFGIFQVFSHIDQFKGVATIDLGLDLFNRALLNLPSSVFHDLQESGIM